MLFNSEHIEQHKKQTETSEGRRFLLEMNIIGDMLENFSEQHWAPEILFKTIREGNELHVEDLNKLHTLSLENDKYKKIYNFYMDLHDGKGTAFLHIQELMKKDSEEKMGIE